MMRFIALLFMAIFIMPFTILPVSKAHAQTCAASITPLNFGSINVAANVAYASSATITYTCTGIPLANIRVCTSIGEGTAGSAAPVPRYLSSGVAQLNMNLYTTASYSNIFGSFLWPWFSSYPGSKDAVTIGLSGVVSFSRTIYGRVLAGQTTKPPGTYTSTYGAGHIAIYYDYSASTNCNSTPTKFAPASFTATANVSASCVVTATDLDFGTVGSLSANVDATSTITAQCTASTPYTIALDGGTSGAGSPTARKMIGGANSVLYGLYQDAGRTQPWGSTTGSNTAAGTGTGNNQSLTVYGRVGVQPTPPSNTYVDTITVTVTY